MSKGTIRPFGKSHSFGDNIFGNNVCQMLYIKPFCKLVFQTFSTLFSNRFQTVFCQTNCQTVWYNLSIYLYHSDKSFGHKLLINSRFFFLSVTTDVKVENHSQYLFCFFSLILVFRFLVLIHPIRFKFLIFKIIQNNMLFKFI